MTAGMFCRIWFLVNRDDYWSKLAEVLVGVGENMILNHQLIVYFRLWCLRQYSTHISIQFPDCYPLSMVAGGLQHILIMYTPVLLVPTSMCSNISLCWLACLFSHEKELSGRQQPQSKSSWHLSGSPWHIKYMSFLVMECAAVFLTCRHRLYYYMCSTAMGSCYSYRESKTRYYWSNWLPINSVSSVSLDFKTSGVELILLKVLSCLQAAFFKGSSALIFSILG